MEKKIIGLFICMLLIAAAFPAVTSVKNSSISTMGPTTQQSSMTEDWTEIQKLLAPDGEAWDWFGDSVSLSGDTAIIGALWDDNYTGSAYVFTRTGTTWTQQQKLLASDGMTGDYFGVSVSISGDTALIGAYDDDNENGADSGSAYVFTHTGTTWTQQQKLLASDGEAGDNFGMDVSLDGDTALIGAYGDDTAVGMNAGSVYVFTKGDGNQPPNKPTITGPVTGKIKVAIDYNFTTTDPDDDNVSYYIDWGDDTNSGWTGSYPSGEVVIKSHTWTKKGDYTIKTKAKDVYGNESDWGQLSVTMPYSYNLPFMQFWMKLLERFPHAFPIFRHLLGY
jgi:hypothetical protein